MSRVRPTASSLLGLLLAGSLAGGCSEKDPSPGDAHAAPSLSPTASATTEEPRLSARQTLAEALDRLESADLHEFVQTVTSGGVAAINAAGVFRLSTGDVRGSVRFLDPAHVEHHVNASVVLSEHRGYFKSSALSPAMRSCWLEMPPPQLHGGPIGVLAHSLGLGPARALRTVRVTGIDRFHQQLHGRLPLEQAVLLFTPVMTEDLAALDTGLTGAVPVTITVADGEVLHWEASGSDVAQAVTAAVGDRVPSATTIVGTYFRVQFSEAGPRDDVAPPPDEDVALDPTGCHGTAA